MYFVFKINVSLSYISKQIKILIMATLKTNQIITCKNIEDARLKSDKISNGIIVEKDNNYSIVNYKNYTELNKLGYNQVR